MSSLYLLLVVTFNQITVFILAVFFSPQMLFELSLTFFNDIDMNFAPKPTWRLRCIVVNRKNQYFFFIFLFYKNIPNRSLECFKYCQAKGLNNSLTLYDLFPLFIKTQDLRLRGLDLGLREQPIPSYCRSVPVVD